MVSLQENDWQMKGGVESEMIHRFEKLGSDFCKENVDQNFRLCGYYYYFISIK